MFVSTLCHGNLLEFRAIVYILGLLSAAGKVTAPRFLQNELSQIVVLLAEASR